MGIHKTYKELEEILKGEREGNTLVLTGGCFDIIHPGHIRLLRKSKEVGYERRKGYSILVVNVVNEARTRMYKGDERPINPSVQRALVVSALDGVDYSTVHPSVKNGPTIELARMIKPDIIVRSKRWGAEERKIIRELLGYDLDLIYLRSNTGFSTTNIIEKAAESYSPN